MDSHINPKEMHKESSRDKADFLLNTQIRLGMRMRL